MPVEGKFGQGKTGYDLSYIRAKRPDTSCAWINRVARSPIPRLVRVFYQVDRYAGQSGLSQRLDNL